MSGGRPRHSYWSNANFQMKKSGGKCVAFCLQCQQVVQNTALKRLQKHRNNCKLISLENSDTLEVVENEQQVDDESHETIIINVIESGDRGSDGTVVDENPDSNDIHDYESGVQSPNDEMLRKKRAFSVEKSPRSSCTTPQSQKDPQKKRLFESFNQVQQATPSTSTFTPSTPNSFFDKISNSENEKLNTALGEFFFGCNIPFSVVDSDHFRRFIKMLRPAYRIPSRKTLSSSILDNIYDKHANEHIITNGKSVLLIDGWKNSSSNSKNVVAMIHNSAGEKLFINSWDMTGSSETGEALTDIVIEAVDIAKQKYKTDIFAIVTDNASAMLKMGRSVELWHITCNSHSANLLAKALVNEQIASEVNTILKEFKQPDLERELVKRNGARVILAGETRWCSYRDAFKCFIKNLPAMRNVVGEGKRVKPNTIAKLFDADFENSIQNCINLFDPVCVLINTCQSENANLADAAEAWLSLRLPEDYEGEHQDILQKRLEKAVNVFSLAANYLHPVYQGKLLTQENLELVEGFLMDSLGVDGLNDLYAYKNKESVFLKLWNKNVSLPKTFWGLAERTHPELSELAKKLLQIPASTAQLERLFSNWSYVHSTIRNRLTSETSKKLIHIYYSLKVCDKNVSSEY